MHNFCYLIRDYRTSGKVHVNQEFKSLFKSFIDLQDIDYPVYSTLPANKHHWTYDYVYKTMIPLICSDYNIPYRSNDFTKHEYFIHNSNLSYLQYAGDYTFSLTSYTSNEHATGHHDIFISPSSKVTYHRVFRYAHQVARIDNKSLHNGKRLLLNCDSMSVPIIPILACYYQSILVLDNRTEMHFFDKIKQFKPNDILTILIAGPDNKWNDAQTRFFLNIK